MRKFFTPITRFWHHVLVAVVAFSIGGGAVAQAVAPSGILGTVRLADRTDDTRMAAIDADGSLQVKVNSVAGTQQVSGTVSVDNFPATQNVNVTGGTVIATPAVATRALTKLIAVDAGHSGIETFTTINASFIRIEAGGSSGARIYISGPIGSLGGFRLGEWQSQELFFTQRVPINELRIYCDNLDAPCLPAVHIIGD